MMMMSKKKEEEEEEEEEGHSVCVCVPCRPQFRVRPFL